MDCINGEDEDGERWQTCGKGRTRRLAIGSYACENVFICKWGSKKYVEYADLCEGIDDCNNENEICSQTRGATELSTIVLTTKNGLIKNLSYCLDGIISIQSFSNQCVLEDFIYPDNDFFGITMKTALFLPNITVDCRHIFGEQYVFTSCVGKCVNTVCPLTNIPRYESCPGQFAQNRVGTLANRSYLALFTRHFGNVYTNKFFVCEDKMKCIDFSHVCDLVVNCGDSSDEQGCTNHFQCNTSRFYIPITQKCDGHVDCLDRSDECNEECSSQILQQNSIKGLSVAISVLAILLNAIILVKNSATLSQCRTAVALVNRCLVILVAIGDFLVGAYLAVISFYDIVIYGNDYCVNQSIWLTSITCSVIGVVSTVGSQLSLFAMTALSIVRVYGIWNSMKIPGEVTIVKYIYIGSCFLLIILTSVAVATVPLLQKFEDFFVNGMMYDEKLRIFVGLPNKKSMLAILEGYYGRMKNSTVSWKIISTMVSEMFSHDPGSEDLTGSKLTVDFYGNDGVCLFKYFVNGDDPQKFFVWSIVILNLSCFILISISYLIIGFLTKKSSKSLTHSHGNKQILQRNKKMNRRITIIIGTDFLCWIPFIITCLLHSLNILNATPWYGVFSMIVLPINSVINPLLYDDIIMSHVENFARRVCGCVGIDLVNNRISFKQSTLAVWIQESRT